VGENSHCEATRASSDSLAGVALPTCVNASCTSAFALSLAACTASLKHAPSAFFSSSVILSSHCGSAKVSEVGVGVGSLAKGSCLDAYSAAAC